MAFAKIRFALSLLLLTTTALSSASASQSWDGSGNNGGAGSVASVYNGGTNGYGSSAPAADFGAAYDGGYDDQQQLRHSQQNQHRTQLFDAETSTSYDNNGDDANQPSGYAIANGAAGSPEYRYGTVQSQSLHQLSQGYRQPTSHDSIYADYVGGQPTAGYMPNSFQSYDSSQSQQQPSQQRSLFSAADPSPGLGVYATDPQQHSNHQYEDAFRPSQQLFDARSVDISTDSLHHQHHATQLLLQQQQQQLQQQPQEYHTYEITRQIPYPIHKQVHVPVNQPVDVKIPHPVLVPVPHPYPIHIPVSKPVAVPVIKEIIIPIEKVVPYPVEKRVPYPVEKHVPYPVEKHITVHVPQPFPVKVPVVKTIYHKARSYRSHGHGYHHHQHNNGIWH